MNISPLLDSKDSPSDGLPPYTRLSGEQYEYTHEKMQELQNIPGYTRIYQNMHADEYGQEYYTYLFIKPDGSIIKRNICTIIMEGKAGDTVISVHDNEELFRRYDARLYVDRKEELEGRVREYCADTYGAPTIAGVDTSSPTPYIVFKTPHASGGSILTAFTGTAAQIQEVEEMFERRNLPQEVPGRVSGILGGLFGKKKS